jgi:hypothetical protein
MEALLFSLEPKLGYLPIAQSVPTKVARLPMILVRTQSLAHATVLNTMPRQEPY